MGTGTGTTSADPTTGAVGTTSGSTTSEATTGEATTIGDPGTTGADTTTGDPVLLDCLFEPFVNKGALSIDYLQFDPIIGSHCKGTNHQDIIDIERVVFLGDSVHGRDPAEPAQPGLPLHARRHAGREVRADPAERPVEAVQPD